MIYLVTDATQNFCKIGYTKNRTTLKTRVSSLQTSCPTTLELTGAISGTRSLESDVHKALSNIHYRGEWFHSCEATDWMALQMSEGYIDVSELKDISDQMKPIPKNATKLIKKDFTAHRKALQSGDAPYSDISNVLIHLHSFDVSNVKIFDPMCLINIASEATAILRKLEKKGGDCK